MKNTILHAGVLIAIAIAVTLSCQKEINFPVNNRSFISGWAFTHSNSEYNGCITSADYETRNGLKSLSIKGSDGFSTFISILIPAPGGKLTNGTTYTAAQGAVLSVDDKDGKTYSSGSPASSFSFKVVGITDTSVIATFKASLSDAANGGYTISNGNVSALLGQNNPCFMTNGTAGYSLIASGSNCSDVSVEGNYNTGTPLSQFDKVSIKVNVTQVGSWSLTTPTTNGMKFSGSGSFTATGVQTIVLIGTGVPGVAGNIAFPIVGTTTSCMFYISVID
jgi:hypothetical protein